MNTQLSMLTKKISSLFSFSAGAYLLITQIYWPFLESKQYIGDTLSDPGSLYSYRSNNILNINSKEEAILGELSQSTPIKTTFDYFNLTIPKLNIENAKVHVNSIDLNPKGFIGHLSGTALPGEEGISFLYGHSVLPWFFDAANYDTIFSTIHTLDFGDTFTVNVNNKSLAYEIMYKVTLSPQQVVPFMKSDYFANSESWVILMTCTPPGLDTKRLLVIGKKK